MQHPLRVIGRLIGFGVTALAALIDFAWSVSPRKAAASCPVRAAWSQRWARQFLRVLNVRVRCEGAPSAKGLLVSNHLSYLDIVVLSAAQPIVFVSKAEVRRWPVIGWLARCAGTVFIRRERKAEVMGLGAVFKSIVQQGVVVGLFPEGTSSDGSQVLPFHSSLLEPAVENAWPISAAWIGYSLQDGCVEDEVCYWRDMTFGWHFLNLLSKKSIEATVVYGSTLLPGLDRKQMAQLLHAQVSLIAEERSRQPEPASFPAWRSIPAESSVRTL